MKRSDVRLEIMDAVVCKVNGSKELKRGFVMNKHGDHTVLMLANCRYGYGVSHDGSPYEESDVETTVVEINGVEVQE